MGARCAGGKELDSGDILKVKQTGSAHSLDEWYKERSWGTRNDGSEVLAWITAVTEWPLTPESLLLSPAVRIALPMITSSLLCWLTLHIMLPKALLTLDHCHSLPANTATPVPPPCLPPG